MEEIKSEHSETESSSEDLDHSRISKHKLKKLKKGKKSKKSKKKKSRHRKYSSSSSGSSNNESSETHAKKKKKKKKMNEKNDEDSKTTTQTSSYSHRDEWMSLSSSFSTFTKSDLSKDKDQEKLDAKKADIYNPGQSSRELNPYWKNGGDGLPDVNRKPNFMKPNYESESISAKDNFIRKSNWRKKSDAEDKTIDKPLNTTYKRNESITPEKGHSQNSNCYLTDQQMNELAAKLVKAEILGNQSLINELKQKLEAARDARKNQLVPSANDRNKEDSILLTTTDSRGFSRPLPIPKAQSDSYYSGKSKNKKVIVETHVSGKRAKYYADDDKHSLHNMFENERFNTTNDQDEEFANIVAKHKNPNDELEDIFAENIRSTKSDCKSEEKAKSRAIREHEKLSQALDNCDRCLDSKKMDKHLIIAMGEHVYLSLLSHEGLHKAHCCIIPMRHVGCSVLLDEEVWKEICDFRKALTRMFHSHSMDVVFFENAIYLHKRPHMIIQCVPGPSKDMELLPFYFKKAIQECEFEWSHNKKLIDLKGKEIVKVIPKGLPYFWVDFGDGTGFAHVVEEQDRFPKHFAQEIIGGMLEIEPRLWRHPKKENFSIQKVNELAAWWKPFDITRR